MAHQIQAKRQEGSDGLGQLHARKSAQGDAHRQFQEALDVKQQEEQELAKAQEQARADVLLGNSRLRGCCLDEVRACARSGARPS